MSHSQEKGFTACIDLAYTALQHALIAHRDRVNDRDGFVDRVLNDRLNLISTDNLTKAKFAVLSSHAEWEGVYQEIVPSLPNCLGDYCRELSEEGMVRYFLTVEELAAFRNEVLYGDQCYKNYLDDLEEFTENYQRTNAFGSLIHLFDLHRIFGRFEEAKAYLYQVTKFFGQEPAAEISFAIFTGMLYHGQPNELTDDDMEFMRQALEQFAGNEESNRLICIYNHVSYLQVWAELIDDYISASENHRLYSDEYPRTFADAADRIFNRGKTALLNISPEFAMTLTNDALDLMKKHDELLLELVEYCPDNTIAPIFRGTELLLWHKRLQLCYPEKLEFFLNNDIPRGDYKHPYNITPEQLLQHLVAEFPDKEQYIREVLASEEDIVDEDEGEATAIL